MPIKRVTINYPEIARCTRCRLCSSRRKVCIGKGTTPSDILFIGEAPGKTEDLFGVPFIGPSGRLLDAMLSDAGLRDRRYFITNTVLCRPCGGLGEPNREPFADEILACSENLRIIIGAVNPIVVVLIGKTAQAQFTKEFPRAFSIMHPSYLLRQGGRGSPNYLRNVSILITLKEELYAGK